MITYNDKHGHIMREIERSGHTLYSVNRVWVSSDDVAVQAIIDNYDTLPDHKASKNGEIKEEALLRINSVFPAIASIDDMQLISELWKSVVGGAKSPTTDMQAAIDIYTAARNAITEVSAMDNLDAVIGYDAATSPAWP